ncbi:MAG TPA: hypothetical protein VJ994_15235 [Paracoccaceae bacterium]|nr:hypothetical protein [Paracoccaceae bacterium]
MAEEDDMVADRMAEKLRAWETDIRNLKARADEAGGEAKRELQKEIEELETQRDKAKAILAKARESSGEASEELKTGFEEAGQAISQAWDRAKARF